MSKRLVFNGGKCKTSCYDIDVLSMKHLNHKDFADTSGLVMTFNIIKALDDCFHYVYFRIYNDELHKNSTFKVIKTDFAPNCCCVFIPCPKRNVYDSFRGDRPDVLAQLFSWENGLYPIHGYFGYTAQDIHEMTMCCSMVCGKAPTMFFIPTENKNAKSQAETEILKLLCADTKFNRVSFLNALATSYSRYIFVEQRKFYLKMMAKYLSPSLIREHLETSVTIDRGFDMDVFSGEASKPRDRKMAWGSVLTSLKNTPVAFEIYEKCYQSCIVDGIVTATTKNSDLVLRFPYAEHNYGLGPTEYCNVFEKCRCFVSAQKLGGYGASNVDMMSSGLLGIYPKGYGYEELLPDNYPFLFSDIDNACSLVKLIMDDTPLYEEWRGKLVEYLRGRFPLSIEKTKVKDFVKVSFDHWSSSKFATSYVKNSESFVQKSDAFVEIKDVLASKDTWKWSEVCSILKEKKISTKFFSSITGGNWVSIPDLHSFICDHCGFKDSLKEADPVYERTVCD